MNNTSFRPVRGTDKTISSLPITDGYIYFATDSGKIYLDKENERILVGGGVGSVIFYGNAEEKLVQDPDSLYYEFPKAYLENEDLKPKIDDIILNSDGAFYRVLAEFVDYFVCQLLSVSGTGEGPGGTGGIKRPGLTINTDKSCPTSLINGQDAEIYFIATSATDADGSILDNNLTITWSLSTTTAGSTEQYYTNTVSVKNGEEGKINIGPYLRESATTTVTLVASGANHDADSRQRSYTVTTTYLTLKQTSSFSPANYYNTTNVVLSCQAEGNTEKIVKCWFDGVLIEARAVSKNATTEVSFSIPSQYTTHGYHGVKIELYQNLGTTDEPIEGLSVDPLEYEIATVEVGNSSLPPIIWLGNYQETYYNYDTIQIPYLVYNPADSTKAVVHLYKNDIEIDSSPQTITDFNGFTYWEIADADLEKQNYYQISCGETVATKVVREISFVVEKDPNRDMTLVKSNNLKLNFSPAGRSNNESSTKRASWSYGEGDNKIEATFSRFNWYNNGWHMDKETNNTCLRISNGASLSIPFGKLVFGSSDTSKQSNSIEMEFKISNIQNYANLITNITRYKGDDEYYKAYIAQSYYDNYDAYLQATLSADAYEALEFDRVQKDINLENVVCGFYSGEGTSITGICVGPQDTFFSNGTNTVSVSFVENEIINLSFVYSHSLKLLFIYINGVITGVIKSSASVGAFTINTDNIVFNSKYCDIDLYKFRIYNTDLNVNDIVVNYAVDHKDINIYDQNLLAKENPALKEYQLDYNNVLTYNEEHPNTPLMPYIIYDTSAYSDNKLPWAKSVDPREIKVTFVNTPLERAYQNGQLESLARADGLIVQGETDSAKIKEGVKTYYKHHCPSWTSTLRADDVVTIQVQGTSSEFYPRRNFKIKTKRSTPNTWDDSIVNDDGTIGNWAEDECLNIYMNRGPYEDIYKEDQAALAADPHYYGSEKSRLSKGWYMNNYTNPTDRWTMKVDYMESSGSYNAGFASMMGEAYSKHPLKDYVDAGVLTNTDKLKSPISGNIDWHDYRTSLLGFPVMAFQKKADGSYLFIGYYRMLLDKSSTQVLGFKTDKKITQTLVGNKKLKDVAECWEFSTNSRTFCSFRDPWNRVELSFKAPAGVANEFTSKLAPVVMNHFEYRYHSMDDTIDELMNYSDLSQEKLNSIIDDLRKSLKDNSIPYYTAVTNATNPTEEDKSNARAASDLVLRFYSNYEKMCQWVWKTNLDNVASQGSYSEAKVGEKLFITNKYYKLSYNTSTEKNEYKLVETYDPDELVYYEKDGEGNYNPVYLTNDNNLVYQPKKFYKEISGTYSLVTDSSFDSSMTYYVFTSKSDVELAGIADLLVEPASTYSASTAYYTYDKTKTVTPGQPTGAVQLVGTLSEDEFNSGEYYVASPKTYVGITYKYDTKEYRAAKFTNEFTKHFDPEYVSTYFIMTEVMECYDSRGKNCMIASWGPQEEGGDYIWYPIFYDIDTQLGINNTGIPSFEFNVDATEAGNFSTSDSILWNNFYKFFKDSYILTKYQNLRGISNSMWPSLTNPPLQSVDYIEGWYSFDPEVTNNIANKGVKPLIATNLDEYFKYITITNDAAIGQGVGYLLGNEGIWAIDKAGTYFYALQGDRSQSRRQFLTNRIEYIDSWLGQKNYARGGGNRIRGRMSANAVTTGITSDKWVETSEDPYWVGGVEFGTKTHEFDSEYWLNLTPIRSSYVTAGDDSANYPPKKYDGMNTVKYKMSELEAGIRQSANYPEQLIYIYGMNQMSDFGDLSKLYFTEFYMEGDASHLTRLQLGSDGYDDNGNKWFNKKLNGITLEDMPLLKEANFSNIGLQNQTALDLTVSEKLENFRAVGTSNLTGVSFADGVALNTLYLPASVTTLSLVQANLLTKVIKEQEAPIPTKDEFGNLVAEPGLFIEGFFTDPYTSGLTAIHLDGGALGYDSYDLLKTFYHKRKSTTGSKLTMSDVKWSPYVQCVEGDNYDSAKEYYIDDGHYGLTAYSHTSTSEYDSLVLNGKIYYKDKEPGSVIDDEFIDILKDLITNNGFTDATGSIRPVISGIVYIENNTALEESSIRTTLQEKYPNLKMFFKTVTKAYSAQFLYKNPETGAFEFVDMADGSDVEAVQKISQAAYNANNNIWFSDPFTLYKPERTHYDFLGWSTNPDATSTDGVSTIYSDLNSWNTQRITAEVYDYKFYAIFEIHSYTLTFHDGDGSVLETMTIPYGTVGFDTPTSVPYKDDSSLGLYSTNGFVGYTDNTLTNKVIDFSKTTVRNNAHYYPVFKEINVYDNIDPSYYSGEIYITEDGRTGVELTLIKAVKGKITIPATFNLDGVNYPVLSINASFAASKNGLTSHIPRGQNLTHVFFALDTQIEVFNMYAFFGDSIYTTVSKLVYVEFPDSLKTIGQDCFARCGSLDYSIVRNDPNARISGAGLKDIGDRAFIVAFKAQDIGQLNIGGGITTIGRRAFYNMNITYSQINIGSTDNYSNLGISLTNTEPKFNNADTVWFYSNNYDASDIDTLLPYFGNPTNLHVI